MTVSSKLKLAKVVQLLTRTGQNVDEFSYVSVQLHILEYCECRVRLDIWIIECKVGCAQH
jgi:hypothetical protein